MNGLISQFINVGILVAIMVYFLREPIRQMVGQRHSTLRDEVKRVTDQLRQAQDRYDEFSSKLKAIDAEVAALRDQARQDAEAMKLKVLGDARRLSSGVVSDARLGVDGLFGELRTELLREFSSRVLERAEGLLRDRLTGADRVRIRREFSSQVEKIQ